MKLRSIFLSVVFILILNTNAKAQTPVTDCYGTIEAWKSDKSLRDYMATHNCYCPSPTSHPVCTPAGGQTYTPSVPSGRGLSPEQQMQIQMFQSILQPFFNSFFDFSNLFTTPSTRSNQQDALLRQQQEEAKRKAIEAWKRQMKEAEEQAKKEAEARRKAGQDILSQVRIGSGFFGSHTIIGPRVTESETLARIDWNNPRGRTVPSTSKSSEIAKEQLLKTFYFSKMAETFLQSGDLEAARFYAGVAFEGGANSPIAIDYKPPKELLDAMDSAKVNELNKKVNQIASFYRLALPKFDKLQDIFSEIEQVKTKKEESEKKIKEAETQIKELEAKKNAKEPDKKDETDDLYAKALALKQQAEAQYQEAVKKEQELLKEKQNIEEELNRMKKELQEGGQR